MKTSLWPKYRNAAKCEDRNGNKVSGSNEAVEMTPMSPSAL